MALRPSTTYLPCPCALIQQSIITELYCGTNDTRCSTEANLYISAQPLVFLNAVLNDDVNKFYSIISIKHFMCEVVVAASCLLSSDKKSETIHDLDMMLLMNLLLYQVIH